MFYKDTFKINQTLVYNDSPLSRDFIKTAFEFCNEELNIKVDILVVWLNKPAKWMGLYTFEQRKVQVVYYDKEQFISTLAHEMRHAWQDQTRFIQYINNRDFETKRDKLELDARIYQKKMITKWRNNNDNLYRTQRSCDECG